MRSDLKKTRLFHLGNVEKPTSFAIFCATGARGLVIGRILKTEYSRSIPILRNFNLLYSLAGEKSVGFGQKCVFSVFCGCMLLIVFTLEMRPKSIKSKWPDAKGRQCRRAFMTNSQTQTLILTENFRAFLLEGVGVG